jgi:hypothetical protein
MQKISPNSYFFFYEGHLGQTLLKGVPTICLPVALIPEQKAS